MESSVLERAQGGSHQEFHRVDDEEAKKRMRRIDWAALEKKLKTSDDQLFDTEVIKALGRLVIELGDNLHNYDTILSDETSGRLPSLFIRKVINIKRQKLGMAPIKNTYFVLGGARLDRVELKKEVEKFIKSKSATMGKTLLVTEHVTSGIYGMRNLIDVLRKQGVDFDTATVSIIEPKKYNQTFGGNLYYGERGTAGLQLWNRMHSGVSGVKMPQAHPESAHASQAIREKIKVAREDIGVLAEELSKLL